MRGELICAASAISVHTACHPVINLAAEPLSLTVSYDGRRRVKPLVCLGCHSGAVVLLGYHVAHVQAILQIGAVALNRVFCSHRWPIFRLPV